MQEQGYLVDNVFNLIKKFGVHEEENQLSASFGFILKNNIQILDSFLKRLGICLDRKDLKNVDIETQVTYEGSRIDLQLMLPNQFLIFIESKVRHTELALIEKQLLKYRKIIDSRRAEYNKGIRLVYVGKYDIGNDFKKLKNKLKLKKDEFLFFSWKDLIKLTKVSKNREIVKLFNNYIGDTMNNKRIIGEQKIKNVAGVLVILTNPAFWELTKIKKIAVQKDNTCDAHYIAFLRIHRGKGLKSAITHIAEVEYTERKPLKETLTGLPQKAKRDLLKHFKERKTNLNRMCKYYFLKKESLSKLAHEISNGLGLRVNLRTTLDKILKAKDTRDMRR